MVFEMRMRRDRDGRIVEKVERVAGEPVAWTYSYDKSGRLFEAHLDGRLICQCHYDREGRRRQDVFPLTHGPSVRNYRYGVGNRLQSAGNNSYTHDANGFRLLWNHEGAYTRYEYAPDHRLLKATRESEGVVFEFDHDDNGQRAAKYRDGQLVEGYQWLDFLRLGVFFDGRFAYRFLYDEGGRTPVAMEREDGLDLTLHYDQIGSLRAVADSSGRVIKEILYDPFGGVVRDTNPALRIPIGFAGGLHDRDLGFVRFGWRDYDTFTSRWTAPDPMGDAGGDPDWYGYCLDDPVNGVDPLGLFRFGKKGLFGLPAIGKEGTTADKGNYQLKHEQGFYEDGTGDNVGLFRDGLEFNENINDYELDDTHFDDERMRKAQASLDPGEYKLFKMGGKSNNCQDYADRLRERYRFLRTAERY